MYLSTGVALFAFSLSYSFLLRHPLCPQSEKAGRRSGVSAHRFTHTFPYFENLYCYSSEKTVLCQSFLFRRQINSIKSPVCHHWFWLYCTKSFRPFFRVFFRFFFRIYYPTTFALSNAAAGQNGWYFQSEKENDCICTLIGFVSMTNWNL